ncbi:DEAD/DEAH box helicase [Sulfuriferula sp. GW1]|uniref:DEAD/DEAH box helicase n=1 Tax=Sulfuriferula sp. GW1 TaxID=3345111 RepID=UPI0039B00BE5
MSSTSFSRCTNILRFWHKIEFFIPFDLQRQVLEAKDAETSVRTFSKDQLDAVDVKAFWLVTPPVGRKLTGFEVFFGVFDKVELTEVTRRVVRETLTPEEEFEQEQRGELEGLTCFARVKVSAQGEPHLDEVSVSTAPWALGCIQKNGLSGLDFDVFQADIKTLKESLNNFRTCRISKVSSDHSTQSQTGDGAQSPVSLPLTGADLSELLKIFYGWASYLPESSRSNSPVLVIRAKSAEDKKKEITEKAMNKSPKDSAVATEDEDDEAAIEDSEIDILNSFYAQDIARAIESLQRGEACPALEAYLTPAADSDRVDLYQSAGRQKIAHELRPDRLIAGHWLDRPNHAMSLMQQFAINSAFENLKTSGVFSVNGPPGTGKTTLLRDIFAENIVRRARALAKYKLSGDAFLPDAVKVKFAGGDKPCVVAQLRDDLTGFEMVVASSNNAAVENISRDIPKSKSLGKPALSGEKAWRDEHGKAKANYLQQIAHNIAARNSKGEYDKLAIDDEPWGLISCALGKKSNRTAFVDRISFAGAKPSEKAPRGFDPKQHHSLWTWRDGYKGLDYNGARLAFLNADNAVKVLIENMGRFAKLQEDLRGHTLASYTLAAAKNLQAAQQAREAAQIDFKAADEEWKLCNTQLELLSSEEQLLEKERPGWWARLMKNPAYKEYGGKLEANRRDQGVWLRRKYEIDEPRRAKQKSEERSTAAVSLATKELESRRADWTAKQNILNQFFKDFPQAACPTDLNHLEQERWQIDGIWRHETLNEKRSELFVAALQLQESWLAEVLKKGGRFGGNIVALCQLLSGKRPQEAPHALTIWQSLFMVVPVVSTTFASFASQFRDLGPNALGWLFIDEAGQAVPQAAVGALWRAKRAVVVGDPLQIEPVFTVPIKLIEALSASSALPSDMDVAPHHVSVQNLADAANPLGAWIGSGEGKQWIGSPLRVHRRCVEPMFSIANEIAYQGKMIFFDPNDPKKRHPPADSFDLGSSAWVHSPGATHSKQAVQAQIDLVHKALAALYQRTGALPPIYIISPFKRIKDELISRISKPENWTHLISAGEVLPKKHALQEWTKARIGTVHTFQGKEESIVWMVLGCDERTQGAAAWAAAKPNLLNVALTRAQHRFFMIGDAALWGGLRHFTAAHRETLPRISQEDFLKRMMHQPSMAL